MDKTAQLIAAVLIMSFVLERVTATIIFLFDNESPDRWLKAGPIALSGTLAAIALLIIDVRLLRDGMHLGGYGFADFLLTWLVLVAGADKISSFTVAAPKTPAAPPPKAEIHVFVENEKGERQEAPEKR
jgi:hypothetical protein